VTGGFIPVFKLVEKGFEVFGIEAPFTLLQKPVKVFLFDAVKAAQVTLGLVPKIFNAVDMIMFVSEAF
jgi:hypothetical protein